MAVAHVATTNTTFGSGSSFNFATPGGAAAGNLLVATFAYQTPSTSDISNTVPAGWTEAPPVADGQVDIGASQGVHIVVATKAAAGGAESPTWTTASSITDAVISVSAYSGAATASPWDVTGYNAQGSTSTTFTTPSVTPTIGTGMLYGAWANRINLNDSGLTGTPTPTQRANDVKASSGTAGVDPGTVLSSADTSGSSVSTSAKSWSLTWDVATTTGVGFLGLIKPGGNTFLATASCQPTGAYFKTLVTKAPFVASSTAVGTFTKIRVVVKILTASVTATGALLHVTLKRLTGTVTAVGVALKRMPRTFTGSTSAIGVFGKAFARKYTGSVTATGAFARVLLGRVFGRPGSTGATVNTDSEVRIRIRKG